MSTESIPDSSACRAKRIQPGMSTDEASDDLPVDSIRYRAASWAEPMATSPPLGSLQWNLALVVPSIGLGSESILTTER